MTLKEIIDILNAEFLYGSNSLNKKIKIVIACDLLSDVLACTPKKGSMLLTNLINPHVIRTGEMVDLSAICFVQNKKPAESTIELAKEKNIPLIRTKFSMYKSCGKLYQNGLPDSNDIKD